MAARFAASRDSSVREQAAIALVTKGHQLGRSGDLAGALEAYDQVVKLFGMETDVCLQLQVAIALVSAGHVHKDRKEYDEAVFAYEDVIARCAQAAEASLILQWSVAHRNEADVSVARGNRPEAITRYRAVADRLRSAPNSELHEQAIFAEMEVGHQWRQLGNWQAAIDSYDNVLEWLGATGIQMPQQVAIAMLSKGHALRDLMDHAKALELYRGVSTMLTSVDDVALQVQLAIALVCEARLCCDLGRWQDAMRAAKHVIARFGHLHDAAFADQVEQAAGEIARMLVRYNQLLRRCREGPLSGDETNELDEIAFLVAGTDARLAVLPS
jgi:tetratricopeptide (TPR) repeat protein